MNIARPPYMPVRANHLRMAREKLAPKEAQEFTKIVAAVLDLQKEWARLAAETTKFSRIKSRAEWARTMSAAVSAGDGRELADRADFVAAQLRRCLPLKEAMGLLSKRAEPHALRLYNLLIKGFETLADEQRTFGQDFTGSEDYEPTPMLRTFEYAAKIYLPQQIEACGNPRAMRSPEGLLLGIVP